MVVLKDKVYQITYGHSTANWSISEPCIAKSALQAEGIARSKAIELLEKHLAAMGWTDPEAIIRDFVKLPYVDADDAFELYRDWIETLIFYHVGEMS